MRDLSTEIAEKKEEQNEKVEMGEELNSEHAKKEKARADKNHERASPVSVTSQPIQESSQLNFGSRAEQLRIHTITIQI